MPLTLPGAAPAPPSSRSILIVDDDAEILDSLEELLGAHYRLTLAPDGAAAMKALCGNEFDLCILDLSLPFVDGFALVKAIESSADVPAAVMLLSGHTAPAL